MIGLQVSVLEADLVTSPINTVDAIRAAAAAAVRAAMASPAAAARLMEPIMALEAVVDEGSVGAVLTDLSSRRGVILSVGADGVRQVVHAEVPLAELTSYSTVLRSLTGGGGDFSMVLAKFGAAS